ncbi:MAG TPA: hypothetical protein VHV49_05435, partial [Pseudonocardiaceae bacterium]|nr:hypothetical protein [Pseudonocardiaceae bacterium]
MICFNDIRLVVTRDRTTGHQRPVLRSTSLIGGVTPRTPTHLHTLAVWSRCGDRCSARGTAADAVNGVAHAASRAGNEVFRRHARPSEGKQIMPELPDPPEQVPDVPEEKSGLSRRAVLRIGAVGATAAAIGVGGAMAMPNMRRRGLANPDGLIDAASISLTDTVFTE